MPTKRYSLNPGEAERLEISWDGSWKNARVSLDGREIGVIPTAKELKAGQEFPLEDGSNLHVQLHQNFIAPELRLQRDGLPLPGSPSDPAERVRVAAQVVFFIGGFTILLSLVTELFHLEALRSLGLGYFAAFFGCIYLVLGYFVQRRSFAALAAAISLFVLDGILALAAVGQTPGHTPSAGLFLRIFLIARMAQGLGAIRALKQEEAVQDVYAGA